jgi:hypothetical protein
MENRTATVIRSPERDSRISLRHAMPRRFNMVMAALAVFAATYFSCPPARCQEPSSKESSNTAAAESKPRAYSAEAIKHYNKGLEFHQSGFFEKAVSEYKLAIASDDRLEQAYSNLGSDLYLAKELCLGPRCFRQSACF